MTTNSPTRRRLPLWLRVALAPAVWLERAKGRWRLALILLYVLIGTALALVWRRAEGLRGLPDIGDPFDVKAFLASEAVPDDRNAFVWYRKAQAALVAATARANRSANKVVDDDEAMQLFLRATAMPDARARDPGDTSDPADAAAVTGFIWRAQLRAARLMASGDMAGAWTWYRACLRAARQVALHGGSNERCAGVTLRYNVGPLPGLTQGWAADPRVDEALLRRALIESLEDEALTPQPSRSYRLDYVRAMRELDDPDRVGQLRDEDERAFGSDTSRWYRDFPAFRDLRWFLKNEPERSRRVLRLAYDNWLSQAEKDPAARPAILSSTATTTPLSTVPFWVYDVPPPSPVAPAELVRQYEASVLAGHSFVWSTNSGDLLDMERRAHANWVLFLAQELYIRRHGKMSATADDLLGPELKRFPPGFDTSDFVPKAATPDAEQAP